MLRFSFLYRIFAPIYWQNDGDCSVPAVFLPLTIPFVTEGILIREIKPITITIIKL